MNFLKFCFLQIIAHTTFDVEQILIQNKMQMKRISMKWLEG